MFERFSSGLLISILTDMGRIILFEEDPILFGVNTNSFQEHYDFGVLDLLAAVSTHVPKQRNRLLGG